MHDKMQELNRIGKSKHEAKKHYRATHENANPAKTAGIHSIKTYEVYKQVSVQFVDWLKQNHANIRHMDDISSDVVIQYLQFRRDQGLSAWTLSRDMSALNKLLDKEITKKEAQLPERSYKKTTRSREERAYDKKYNPENYRPQIEVAKSFGLRRESILGGDYQLREGSIFKHDGKIYAAVIEKGGRFRNAPCLESMKDTIEKHFPNIKERDLYTKEEFKRAYDEFGNHLFDRYTSKIDNHAFRHEYARNLYEQIEKDYSDLKSDYRGYDERILREVSEALGHSRPSVVVEHYLR